MKRKTLETLGLLVTAALLSWFAFVRPSGLQTVPIATTASDPTAPPHLSVEQELLGAAAAVNAKVPQMVDEETILEKATVTGRTLTFHYRSKAKASQRARLRSLLLLNIVPKTCTGPLRKPMRDRGVSYAFSYVGEDFSDPVAITVNEAICARPEG